VLSFVFKVFGSGNFPSDPPPVCIVSQTCGRICQKLCENRGSRAPNVLYSRPGISLHFISLSFSILLGSLEAEEEEEEWEEG